MENSLVSGVAEACGQDLGISNVSFSESCPIEGESFQKLAKLHAVNGYLASMMEKRLSGQPNLVVFCHGIGLMKEPDQPLILYVSDPFRSIQLPYHQEIERFLAEGAGGNASLNSTHCDEVCQIKSSLLEGVLAGMVIGDGLIMNGKFLAVSRSVFISASHVFEEAKIFLCLVNYQKTPMGTRFSSTQVMYKSNTILNLKEQKSNKN